MKRGTKAGHDQRMEVFAEVFIAVHNAMKAAQQGAVGKPEAGAGKFRFRDRASYCFRRVELAHYHRYFNKLHRCPAQAFRVLELYQHQGSNQLLWKQIAFYLCTDFSQATARSISSGVSTSIPGSTI